MLISHIRGYWLTSKLALPTDTSHLFVVHGIIVALWATNWAWFNEGVLLIKVTSKANTWLCVVQGGLRGDPSTKTIVLVLDLYCIVQFVLVLK